MIDGVTISQINSSGGSINIRQVCGIGGKPPYLGNDIDINALKGTVGDVEISQNCGECFIYDVDNPSNPPIPIECGQDTNPTIKTKRDGVIDYISRYKIPELAILTVMIVILILILFYFQNRK